MDWQKIISGILIASIIGIGSTLFWFQERISKLEVRFESIKQDSSLIKKRGNLALDKIDKIFKQSNYFVNIEYPKNDEKVNQNILVKGTFSGDLSNFHLWAVIHSIDEMGWWPQIAEIIPDPNNGDWKTSVTIGDIDNNNIKFDIQILLAKKEAHESFLRYLDDSRKTDNYPPMHLPSGTRMLSDVTVIRK